MKTSSTSAKPEGNTFHGSGDPLNVRISNLIRDHVYSGPVGRGMMEQSRQLQLDYYRDSLAHLGDGGYMRRRNQQVLKDLATVGNSRIIEGKEFLDELPKGLPYIALLNHFSVYKETGIDQGELGLNLDLPDGIIPPPLMHFSSVYPVAEELGDSLHDIHLRLPGVLGEIQEQSGFVGVPPGTAGQLDTILKDTEAFFKENPGSLMVSFPEGGTSGRTNNGGPFSLLDFRKGTFVIAAKLGIPIVPLAQYFNPQSGFEIGVFKPIRLNLGDDLEAVARATREEMQGWLDKRIAATTA